MHKIDTEDKQMGLVGYVLKWVLERRCEETIYAHKYDTASCVFLYPAFWHILYIIDNVI